MRNTCLVRIRLGMLRQDRWQPCWLVWGCGGSRREKSMTERFKTVRVYHQLFSKTSSWKQWRWLGSSGEWSWQNEESLKRLNEWVWEQVRLLKKSTHFPFQCNHMANLLEEWSVKSLGRRRTKIFQFCGRSTCKKKAWLFWSQDEEETHKRKQVISKNHESC